MVRVLEDPELGQLAWHLGSAARNAAAGEFQLARTETFLAWAVLGTCDAFRIDETTVFDTLVDPGDPSAANGSVTDALEEARAAAYALMAHFTSEQRFDLVAVYERAEGVINGAVTRLRNSSDLREPPSIA